MGFEKDTILFLFFWVFEMASDGGGGEGLLSTSPVNKVKFLCSHGGKILPRAVDGGLKYVGGETRVVAIPRDIKLAGTSNKYIYFFSPFYMVLLNVCFLCVLFKC